MTAPERVPSAEPAGPPPKKKSAMTCLIIGLCVGVGGFVVLGILAAVLGSLAPALVVDLVGAAVVVAVAAESAIAINP